MPNFSKIFLHNNKIDAVKRFHPWIFSGAIKRKDPDLKEGEIVEIYSNSGEYLATGHYNTGNIAVKILAFEKVLDISKLFLEKFQNAYSMRKQIGLAASATNCYRLINAEGDGLPGLIVDWYNGTAVLQAYSMGMYQHRQLIVECLQQVYGQDLKAVYDKSASVLSKTQIYSENQYLLGSRSDGEVLEYGHRFFVDWEEGQKTGFFIDQRENRFLLSKYVTGKRVLNTFCYSGGFSVYALKAGASYVCSVDSSAKAIAWTTQNVALNNPAEIPHQTYVEDIFDFLKGCDDYDVIILDPPAFAKNLSARHQAVMAYKRLNQLALTKLRSGGILFTFSCSQVVGVDHFKGAVTAAAIESSKPIRLLHQLAQSADHPVSIYHPEGLYLKGLVLMVG
ncbi:MAG: class I SAM-dependent rRNA methyltransferase [Hydrococcus sp. Prado102]|jgi:23S rRNA (cytosine1962-C5)-methyltransferase|nr:class I SAM-dependent rRNA methyltransferase [Hydrococcus sp. Prado102]